MPPDRSCGSGHRAPLGSGARFDTLCTHVGALFKRDRGWEQGLRVAVENRSHFASMTRSTSSVGSAKPQSHDVHKKRCLHRRERAPKDPEYRECHSRAAYATPRLIWFPRAAWEPSADAPASRSTMSPRYGLHSHSGARKREPKEEYFMGRSRYTIYENQAPHFLTCTVNNWIPIFTRPATVQVILDALACRQEQRCLKIYAFESRRWRVLSGIPTRRAGTRWLSLSGSHAPRGNRVRTRQRHAPRCRRDVDYTPTHMRQ